MENAPMAELILALGRIVVQRDTSTMVKVGAFILYSFEECGILRVAKKPGKKHAVYVVEILKGTYLEKHFKKTNMKETPLPSIIPLLPWEGFTHEDGSKLVKTSSREVFNMNVEEQPMIFEAVNKSQSVGWKINKDLLRIYEWALVTKNEAFDSIWNQQNDQALESKLREANIIRDMAMRLKGDTFYHMYYFDFRGRRYPRTPYLHEQSSDNARGLLLREDKERLNETGLKWLKIGLANNWGGDDGKGGKTDKLSIRDRVAWVDNNIRVIMSFGAKPKCNKNWMKADKVWEFLAGCIELYKHHSDETYESSLEVFIDGLFKAVFKQCEFRESLEQVTLSEAL